MAKKTKKRARRKNDGRGREYGGPVVGGVRYCPCPGQSHPMATWDPEENPQGAIRKAPLPTGLYPQEIDRARPAYDHGFADAVLVHARDATGGMTNAVTKYGAGSRSVAYFWGWWQAVATGASSETRRANPETTYERTHGGLSGPVKTRRARVPDPKAGPLTEMGRIKRIEYITDKGRGESLYFHDFGKVGEKGRAKDSRMPILAFNREGLVIAGGSYTVKPEGIVG